MTFTEPIDDVAYVTLKAMGVHSRLYTSHAYDYDGGVDAHAFTLFRQANNSQAIWMESRSYMCEDTIVYAPRPRVSTKLWSHWGDEALWVPEPPLPVALPVEDIQQHGVRRQVDCPRAR